VLRELTRQSLEAHQRPQLLARPDRRNELVERALATGVARIPRSAQQLHTSHIRLLGQLGHQQLSKRPGLPRPAHASALALRRAVERPHRRLSRDALHAALRDAGELHHLLEAVPGQAQNLDHPFPRQSDRWPAFYPEPRPGHRGGQNFRNRRRRRFFTEFHAPARGEPPLILLRRARVRSISAGEEEE